jgi:hypothetical protein
MIAGPIGDPRLAATGRRGSPNGYHDNVMEQSRTAWPGDRRLDVGPGYVAGGLLRGLSTAPLGGKVSRGLM